MELQGKIWKDGKFWLVEIPTVNVCTQGYTRKEALMMIEDAIFELLIEYFSIDKVKDIKLYVSDIDKNFISISSSDNKLMLSFSLIRQREISKSTVREVADRLGSSSPNSYAQYERGRMSVPIEQFERLLKAVNPEDPPKVWVG